MNFAFDRQEGVEGIVTLHDGVMYVVTHVHKYDPSFMILCQFDGATVQPIRSVKDVPKDPTLLFMFAFIERKWLLGQPFTPKKKESD